MRQAFGWLSGLAASAWARVAEIWNYRFPITVGMLALLWVAPTILGGAAIWFWYADRDDRRALVADVFAETRATTLYNCRETQKINVEISKVFLETKTESIKTKRELIRQRAFATTADQIVAIQGQIDRLDNAIAFSNRKIEAFAPDNCLDLPLIRRGEEPFAP